MHLLTCVVICSSSGGGWGGSFTYVRLKTDVGVNRKTPRDKETLKSGWEWSVRMFRGRKSVVKTRAVTASQASGDCFSLGLFFFVCFSMARGRMNQGGAAPLDPPATAWSLPCRGLPPAGSFSPLSPFYLLLYSLNRDSCVYSIVHVRPDRVTVKPFQSAGKRRRAYSYVMCPTNNSRLNIRGPPFAIF